MISILSGFGHTVVIVLARSVLAFNLTFEDFGFPEEALIEGQIDQTNPTNGLGFWRPDGRLASFLLRGPWS